jgi:hypothetical protein
LRQTRRAHFLVPTGYNRNVKNILALGARQIAEFKDKRPGQKRIKRNFKELYGISPGLPE